MASADVYQLRLVPTHIYPVSAMIPIQADTGQQNNNRCREISVKTKKDSLHSEPLADAFIQSDLKPLIDT